MKSMTFFSKRQLIKATTFIQGTHEAVDTRGHQKGILQIWATNYTGGGFAEGDSISIFVQDAIENQEDFYSDSTEVGEIKIVPLEISTVTGNNTAIVLEEIALPKRFMRLKVSIPASNTALTANIRAVISLGD